MENFIDLNPDNISTEHICCAFSDKKCKQSYEAKKEWLRKEFGNGYVFRRINARAKVFIEYGPAELGWVPVEAPDYLLINCLWVSGQYKGKGYGKALLQTAVEDAKTQNRQGIVTVAGKENFHFISNAKWFIRQGFEICDTLPSGFLLLVKKIGSGSGDPAFSLSVKNTNVKKDGLVAYYSNRCPFAEFHVTKSLPETASKRKLLLTVVKLETMEQAQSAPSPATIFSLFYNGRFITTDISACLDSRFDKVLAKEMN